MEIDSGNTDPAIPTSSPLEEKRINSTGVSTTAPSIAQPITSPALADGNGLSRTVSQSLGVPLTGLSSVFQSTKAGRLPPIGSGRRLAAGTSLVPSTDPVPLGRITGKRTSIHLSSNAQLTQVNQPLSGKALVKPPGQSVPQPSTLGTQEEKFSTNTSLPSQQQPSQPLSRLSQLSNKQIEAKEAQWLAHMRAMSGGARAPPPSPALGAPSAMDQSGIDLGRPPLTRGRAVRFAASEGEEDDDVRSVQSGGSDPEVLAALRSLADIAVFQAECLAKISGVPLPDFEPDEDVSEPMANADL